MSNTSNTSWAESEEVRGFQDFPILCIPRFAIARLRPAPLCALALPSPLPSLFSLAQVYDYQDAIDSKLVEDGDLDMQHRVEMTGLPKDSGRDGFASGCMHQVLRKLGYFGSVIGYAMVLHQDETQDEPQVVKVIFACREDDRELLSRELLESYPEGIIKFVSRVEEMAYKLAVRAQAVADEEAQAVADEEARARADVVDLTSE